MGGGVGIAQEKEESHSTWKDFETSFIMGMGASMWGVVGLDTPDVMETREANDVLSLSERRPRCETSAVVRLETDRPMNSRTLTFFVSYKNQQLPTSLLTVR